MADEVAATVTVLPVSTVLVSAVLVLVISVFLICRRRYVALFEDIPGPKGYPVVGNALDFIGPHTETFNVFSRYRREFGDVCVLWVGGAPYVLLGSAEAVEPVLSASEKVIEKNSDYDLFKKWIGTGLATSKGEKWAYRRNLLVQSFHLKILESFIVPASTNGDVLVGLLKKEVGNPEVDVVECLNLVALDIIAETAMGHKLNALTNSNAGFIKAIKKLSAIVQIRTTAPWLKNDFIYKLTSYAKEEDNACKIVHGLRDTIVKRRRATKGQLKMEKRQEGKQRLSLLDFMLENNMSDEDIGEEVDTAMFAGHHAVATNIAFCLFIIAKHKDVQVKILEEFHELTRFAENRFSLTCLNKLVYLERCVKEVMRLYTPVPFIGRLTKEPLKINNHCLPEGTNILLFLHAVHQNPRDYPNPEKFDPDRFLPENVYNRHPFSYVPFSGGLRNCIGQKYAMLVVKIIILKVLEAYDISTSMQQTDLKLYCELALYNKGGIKIAFQERKRQTI